jgi:integrase
MSYKIAEIHTFRDGKLHLYKRTDSRYWLCRFYADKKYKVASTKETAFGSAKRFCLEWFDKLKYEETNLGIPIHGRKFTDVVEEYMEYQRTLIGSGELSEGQANDYRIKLFGVLKYFNKHSIQAINAKLIYQYTEKRLKECSFDTIKKDFSALRQVFYLCQGRGYIEHLPDFPKRSRGKKKVSNPRVAFSKDEWKHLQKVSKDRIKNASDKNKKYKREQLHDYMMWMVHTGCRVAETLRTTYGSVKIVKNDSGEETNISIQGKTGFRKIRGTEASVSVFNRISKRHPKHKKTDKLFPFNHKDGLNNLLNEAKLKESINGTRNAKSFRSAYMMFRLDESKGNQKMITFLARNCGTSISMVDKFYLKHFSVEHFDSDVISLPKSKKKKSKPKK